MNYIKKLGKESIIYGLGTILAKSVGLITIPIFTRIFSTEIYGRLELLLTMGAFFVPIIVMGTDSAQSYYYFNFKKNNDVNRKTVVNSILFWKVIWGILIIISFYPVMKYVNNFLFNGVIQSSTFQIILISSYLTAMVMQFTNLQRLLYKPKPFIAFSFLLPFLSSVISILLVLNYDFSYTGVIFGNLISLAILLICLLIYNSSFLSIQSIEFTFLKKMIRFSFPFLPEALIWYLFSYADRWFVVKMLGESELGVYSVGAKIGLLLILTTNAFRLAWSPIAMENMNNSNDGKIFTDVSRYYLGLGAIFAIILTFFSKIILFILTTEKYFEAFVIVGPMAIQAVLSSYNLVISPGILKTEKTFYFPICLIFGALTNIVLNYYLIPVYGILGAAISTLAGYTIWNILLFAVGVRLWPIEFPKLRIILIFITLCAGVVLLTLLLNHETSYMFLSLVLFFFTLLLTFETLTKDEITKIILFLKNA